MKEKGFSLIELSIVILIVSILASGLVNIMGKKNYSDRIRETKAKLQRISEAIKIYKAVNYKIPCPAYLAASLAQQTFGAAIVNGGGFCNGYAGTDAGTNVMAGGIPFVDLGLPPQYAFDSWGNRISYIIDRELTLTTDSSTWAAASTQIRLLTSVGGSDLITRPDTAAEKYAGTAISNCYGSGTTTPSSFNTRIPVCPAFILLSHGPNGYLSYDAKGVTQNTTTFGESAAEKENTIASVDGNTYDYIFVDTNQDVEAKTNTADYFDDILLYRTKEWLDGTNN